MKYTIYIYFYGASILTHNSCWKDTYIHNYDFKKKYIDFVRIMHWRTTERLAFDFQCTVPPPCNHRCPTDFCKICKYSEFFFKRYDVSLNYLPERMQDYMDCSCLIFLYCVFWKVSFYKYVFSNVFSSGLSELKY